jgi:PhnB protein
VRPVKDQFYGDRLGTVEGPFGHLWHVSTHKEDLSADELKRRAEKAMGQSSG